MKTKLVGLCSGNGLKLQSVLDACSTGKLNAIMVVVISNKTDAYILDRAEIAGVTALYHPLQWFYDTGRTREEYDESLVELLTPYEPEWVLMESWTPPLGERFTSRCAERLIRLDTIEQGNIVEAVQHALNIL